MKPLKIQYLFSNPKNTPAVTITQKIQIFEIQNPKNTPLILALLHETSYLR